MPADAGVPGDEAAQCSRRAVIAVYGGWFVATCACGWTSAQRPTRALARTAWNVHYAKSPEAAPLVNILRRLGRFGDG